MNVWKEIYDDRLKKEENLLHLLSQEYDRIGKGEDLKLIRKIKVKEIKMQCQKIRNIRKEYLNKIKKEKKKWKMD